MGDTLPGSNNGRGDSSGNSGNLRWGCLPVRCFPVDAVKTLALATPELAGRVACLGAELTSLGAREAGGGVGKQRRREEEVEREMEGGRALSVEHRERRERRPTRVLIRSTANSLLTSLIWKEDDVVTWGSILFSMQRVPGPTSC